MITIQLKEFIRTGVFGPISIGTTKADVIKYLGKKFDFGNFGESQIIRYACYEFFFWTKTETLFAIQNDHLTADCGNHKDMINFKNRLWTLDKWFLKDNENVTFAQIIALLNSENIPFEITVSYPTSNEKIIRCLESGVTFDFVNEHQVMEFDSKGNLKGWKEVCESEQSNFVLNGIRLFRYDL